MSNEDHKKLLGIRMLRRDDEATTVLTLLRHIMLGGDIDRQLDVWSQKSVLKTAVFRAALAGRAPYRHMTSSDRSQRQSEVIEILLGDGIFVPLSVKETVEELGERARNTGSFVRVVNIHRLKRAAGIDVSEPLPGDGMHQIVRKAPRAYDVFMAEQRLVLPPDTSGQDQVSKVA